MKDQIILVLCALALARGVDLDLKRQQCNCNPSEAQQICEANYGSDNILIAHENCDKFYKCAHGKPEAITCPANLLYDPVLEVCNWAHEVDCGDRPISDGTDQDCDGTTPGDVEDSPATCNCDPSEAPSICAADGSNGALVAHENCNQFYICSGGAPLPLVCPPGLLYNPYTTQCDWPQNVECGDRVIPELDDSPVTDNNNDGNDDNNDGTCNCNPGEAPSICAAPGSEGVLIAHENCNQYYICNFGRPIGFLCPGQLLYNPYLRVCDYPLNVDCGDRVVPEPENNCPSCNGGDGVDIDDVPLQGEGNNNVGGGNCNPSEAPAICAANDSNDVLVAHENCNQYYICLGGKPIARPCPGNLLFNPISDQCDWPEKVNCGDRVIPDPDNDNSGNDNGGSDNGGSDNGGSDNGGNDAIGGGNCDPSEAPAICAADGSNDVLVAHENCNKYYICLGGKPIARPCPGNLLFNPNSDQCDWPQNVDCGDRVIPDPDDDNSGNDNGGSDNGGSDNGGGDNGGNDAIGGGNCDPSEAPAICAADGSNDVLVAHENCNKYYICLGGKPIARPCPGNLLFNPISDQCDWPEKVDCGERVIPDPDDDNNGNDNGGSDNGGSDNGSGDNGGSDSIGGGNCDPSEAPTICAADGSNDVLVAHENCNKYYICLGGKPIARPCPGNLLFNPNSDQCDWPQNVDCGDRVIPDPDDDNSGNDNGGSDNGGSDNGGNGGVCNCNPGEAPKICMAENSNGTLIAHENCDQFYLCDHGKPVAMSCPDNLLYNPYKEECDWPVNVKCGDRNVPNSEDSEENKEDIDNTFVVGDDQEDQVGADCENDKLVNEESCNCRPEDAPSICSVGGSDGVYIAHEYCNRFYQCSNGKPVAIRCPRGLLYNPVNITCDWPHNVECGDRIIPDSDEDDDVNESEEVEDNENDGTCNCNPEEAPAICAAEGSSGVLVAHENCNQFYKCANGVPVAFTCSASLLYNPYRGDCDWPSNVECGNRPISVPDDNNVGTSTTTMPDDNQVINDDPSQAPSICAENGSSGVLVAHENCNQYYICSAGRPVPMPCSSGLLFNPVNRACDWPQNVVCGDRLIPEDDCACNPRNAPKLCSQPNSDGRLVAHENCNQFYFCAGGVPLVLSCPNSLLFNADQLICDWPQNVNCNSRMFFAALNKHLESRQLLRK
uniref:Peritrophic membrane chitin binding protein 1 n=1 Tax=Trichoplusia ni TaxID=7111 RepID=Q6VAP0_TRINI|nr:peritrophic membrane chitin binding protein 1 [Trichoplusia ni]